jgi:hypothetical protein
MASGPRLRRLELADPPSAWERLGFRVSDSRLALDEVELVLGAPGQGISGWAIAGLDDVEEIDGLAVGALDGPAAGYADPGPAETHPNGATGIDHLVLVSPAFDRTAAALEQAGLPLRRVTRSARGMRQGFRRLGPVILELVGAPEAAGADAAGDRPQLWGLTVIVEDIDALAERLGDELTPVKPAVQPGRRIATLRPSAGLSTAVAFMDPPGPSSARS